MTDSLPGSDSTPTKPRGLWSLMGTPQSPADDQPESIKSENVAKTENDDELRGLESPDEAVATSDRRSNRGLWGMMHSPNSELPVTEAPSSIQPPINQGSAIGAEVGDRNSASRGLFALMNRADRVSETPTAASVPSSLARAESLLPDDESGIEETYRRTTPLVDQGIDDPDLEEVGEYDDEDQSSEIAPRPVNVQASVSSAQFVSKTDFDLPHNETAYRRAIRQTWIGIGCGVTALATAPLSMSSSILAGIPSTVFGFIAIISGYLVLTGPGRRVVSGSKIALSMVAMLLGTGGIFLGPLLFVGLGRNLRETTGPRGTRQHLQRVGEGLDRHYAEHNGYPIGGTFARDDAGKIRGQHGWMTFLLPSIGEADLYREIDQSKPYDDPVNRNAMGKNVSIYFAAGGDKSRIGQGYSVSHFAGLGGEVDSKNGLAHVGIFERDVAVQQAEITDGLSNTLIVGELAGAYPPWGDPENWRTIGRGLNKDFNGFGSYSGSGATFLLGDGAVKFFSNRTDPKLLEHMSTRDGSE